MIYQTTGHQGRLQDQALPASSRTSPAAWLCGLLHPCPALAPPVASLVHSLNAQPSQTGVDTHTTILFKCKLCNNLRNWASFFLAVFSGEGTEVQRGYDTPSAAQLMRGSAEIQPQDAQPHAQEHVCGWLGSLCFFFVHKHLFSLFFLCFLFPFPTPNFFDV